MIHLILPSLHFLTILCRFTADVGGYPFLYADTFMTREEFKKMFDLTAYELVRHKYSAEGAFPHLHDKVSLLVGVSFECGCHGCLCVNSCKEEVMRIIVYLAS